MVWPAARGMVRKLTELVLALIFSKVVIAVAFSVGAAALAGVDNAGHADAGSTSGVSASAGTLFSGLVIFGLAAFAPFVVLKLFPAAEAAIVAQGISRGPVRTTQQASASAFYLERLAGAHGNGSNGAAGRAPVQPGGDFGSGPPGGSPNGGGAAPGRARRRARPALPRAAQGAVVERRVGERPLRDRRPPRSRLRRSASEPARAVRDRADRTTDCGATRGGSPRSGRFIGRS